MKKYLLFSLLLLGIGSCKNDKETVSPYFPNDRLYVHAFFASEEECAKQQPDPNFWVNCDQRVRFYQNGKVELMLTDIINRGTYRRENKRIILNMDQAGDAPEKVAFSVSSDNLLIREDDQTEWTLE